MNIAILSGRDPYICTDTDGGSVYLEYLQSKLSTDRHAVTTYIPRGVRGGLISEERSVQQQSGVRGNNRIIYFPVEATVPRNAIISEEDYFLRRIEISNSFVAYFSDRKLFAYDVVFVLHCANAFGIARHNLLPFDRTVLFPMMTSVHYQKFTTVPDAYVRLERETLSRMQHISTPSDDERRALTDAFSVSDSAVFKTHRGFSPDDFPFVPHLPPRNRKRITIFSANGIRPQKGHAFFIEVGRALLSAGIIPNIVLTGNNGRSHNPHYNAYATAFWRRVRDANMERYIVAHGVVPRAQLVSFMRSADIALYPSIAETFGKSALESVVSGLPTFVFDDVPAFSEFITHNRTGIITPRDAITCAHEIVNLCTKNAQRYAHIVANGALLRNTFSWNAIMDTLFKQMRQGEIMKIMYPFTDEAKRAAVTPTELRVEEILSLLHTPSRADTKLITRGYEFAKGKHKGQVRYSGAPYFHHPFETAKYLAGIQMPASMIVAGLLHDVIEDAGVAPNEIREHFGDDIAALVESVTKLGTVRYRGMKRHVESLRKLFAATSRDIRVMVVKLMDRLHNARTLHFVPEHKRERIALETLEIYAPIADRLGMGLVKRELEDGVFPHAYPEEYKKVSKIFKDAGGGDLKRLERIHNNVRKKIAAHGLKHFRTASRVKGLYSLFRKLERKNWDITKIYDIWALRVIVTSAADCYTVLGIVHGGWHPLPGRMKDYIAFPKPNGYRSIHTTILTGDGGVIELQIRTEEMHREAQLGIASHFAYKEHGAEVRAARNGALGWIRQFVPARLWMEGMGKTPSGGTTRTYAEGATPEWIRYMVDAHEGDVNPRAFLNDIKADFFSHRIFVFTPRGDVIDLPIDSRPIDFAYAIHSDIGNHMAGVKVNGKMAALNTCLKNGDIVEIMTSDKAHPSGKWLRMAKTTLAKRHIRNYLQKKSAGA